MTKTQAARLSCVRGARRQGEAVMAVSSGSSRRFTDVLFRHRPGAPRALVVAAVVAVGTAACASSSSSPAAASSTAASTAGAPKPSANFITAEEIDRVHVQNGYEAIQKLRPALLRQRQVASANGQGGVSRDAPPVTGTNVSAGSLILYVDGTRIGDVDQLRQISASSIATMRYYSPSEAQMKWGSGHPGGVIEVISKR
jgi:hypothetical protein